MLLKYRRDVEFTKDNLYILDNIDWVKSSLHNTYGNCLQNYKGQATRKTALTHRRAYIILCSLCEFDCRFVFSLPKDSVVVAAFFYSKSQAAKPLL